MADLKISALNSLAGADLVAADVVAVVDDSASETKKLTVSDLIANGTTLISDATIPSAKILFSAGAIDTAELAASAVETAKINDSAVTAAKLADNSSVTLVSTLPASGDFTGQIALDTDDDKIYIWDGSAWDSVKGAGSINVVNGSTSGIVNITTSTSGDTVTVSTTLDDTTAAAQFLAGPTGSAGTVGYRAIIGTDLPTATTTAKGGVIVNGEGLRMDSDTIEIDNDITANSSTFQAVKFDSKGLITSGRDITSADLPDATDGATGAVKPGTGLEMGTAGAIDHSNSVAAATNTKITYDAQGHVTAGTTLAASDIPDLDTAKITTGSFATARIADDAVTAAKLANFTVAQISETTPTADFTSQFFFNPITRDLFLWDGNVFQPVGISAGEIVLAGTYDANTNQLDSVTADGTAAGFESGSALPAAATGNNRHYVVVSQSGTGTSPAPTVTLEPPDILLSNGTSYVLIETSETITAQVASNVGFTATGNIASTNVQGAIAEVDNEKVAKGGDTMTGDLTLNDADIVFEGATENDFETTLTVTDPTADRTITLPNVTGTVVTTGDTGTVTSTMISDGTIVNADISASAEIAVSKLANGTARQLLQTDSAGTGVEFTSNVDVPGTFDCTGAGTFDSTLTVTGLISADGKVSFPAGTASAPSFYFGTDTNTGLYHSAADEVAITTGGTQRVVVDSSGRVLSGASSSSANVRAVFQGNSAGATGAGIVQIARGNTFTASDTNIGNLEFTDSSSNVFGRIQCESDSTVAAGSDHPGRITFETTADGAASPSERLRVDSSGRMFLGTTSVGAADRFAIHHGSDAANIVAITGADQSTEYLGLGIESGVPTITAGGFTTTSASLVFKTASSGTETERLRIDSSGNVIIGTGSLASNVRLRIKAENSYKSVLQFADQDDDNVGEISYNHDDNTLAFNVNDSERMRIDSSGRLLVSGQASLTSTSLSHSVQIAADSSAQNIVCFGRAADDISAIDFYEADKTTNLGEIQYRPDHVNFRHRVGYIAFATGGTDERMRVDSSGNVLINTTTLPTSDSKLTVQNSGSSCELNVISGTSSGSVVNMGDTDDYNDGRIKYDNSSRSMQFQTANAERMRITSSGSVGIGTTAPDYDFQLAKSSAVLAINATNQSSSGTSLLLFRNKDGVGDTRNVASVGGLTTANGGNGALVFKTAASGSQSEQMRIDSSGNVLIGTTSTGNGTVGVRFNSSGQGLLCAQDNPVLICNREGGDGTVISIQNDESQVGTIVVSGSSTAYNTSSDYRLKENVVDLSGAIDRVKQLAPKRFNFIADADRTVDGFLAHEAQTVVPEAVTGEKDGEEMQGIDQSKLVPLLTAALQEAIAKIETLEAKVAALEAE